MVGIYKITSPSAKVYIGQSWKMKERHKSYRNSGAKKQLALQNSFLKYGSKNHLYECIAELPSDVDQKVLDTYEILYWQLYKDCGVKMLNIKEPGKGGRLSEEMKRKKSVAMLGRKLHTEESKKKISIANTGNKYSLGTKRTQEQCAALSARMKGRVVKEISIERRKQTMNGRVIEPHNKGKKASDEVRANISKSKLLYFKTHSHSRKIDRNSDAIRDLIKDYIDNILPVSELIIKHKVSASFITKLINEKGIPLRNKRSSNGGLRNRRY